MTALTCPICGSTRLFGPAGIVCGADSWDYYDCGCCGHILLVMADGSLSPRGLA